MPHLDHDMLYAAIFTLANMMAIGGAGWLLLSPSPHEPAEPAPGA